MHNAPSVNYPVGRSRWAAALLALAWLAGAAVAWGWSAQPDIALWRPGAAWLALAGSGLFALRTWQRGPEGVLAWDGSSWSWTGARGAAVAGRLRVSIDLQFLLLVSWHDADGRRWLWLERARVPERWSELRRAVYSRARPALPVAGSPAAKP